MGAATDIPLGGASLPVRIVSIEYDQPGKAHPVAVQTTLGQWRQRVATLLHLPPFSTAAFQDFPCDHNNDGNGDHDACAYAVVRLQKNRAGGYEHVLVLLPRPVFELMRVRDKTVVDVASIKQTIKAVKARATMLGKSRFYSRE